LVELSKFTVLPVALCVRVAVTVSAVPTTSGVVGVALVIDTGFEPLPGVTVNGYAGLDELAYPAFPEKTAFRSIVPRGINVLEEHTAVELDTAMVPHPEILA
jgi:hypothetical protein